MFILMYRVQMWSPQYRRDVGLLECIQRWATKMIQWMEHLFHEAKLGELVPFNLEKSML